SRGPGWYSLAHRLASQGDGGMRFLRRRPVAGSIAFDYAEEEAHLHHSGGTRLASDLSDSEVALLARCMSYKFGILGIKIIGATTCDPRSGSHNACSAPLLQSPTCLGLAPMTAAR